MKIKKGIILVVLFFCALLIFSNKSYAGTQSWNSLNYDATINSDGSMSVVETWDISISETNTLFKDFKIDSSKYSGIEDVSVTRVYDNNLEENLTQIYEEQYHVDSGCFYALEIYYNTFEIAWNVGLDNSSENRIYKLYYTIKDAVSVYNDCTELYWQFLGTDNAISGKNITGTITFQNPVSNIENLKVWAHGPLTGEIQKISSSEVYFEVPNLSSQTMVEVRIVSEDNFAPYSIKKTYNNMLSSILEEEQNWANEANMKRKIYTLVFTVVGAIVIGILLLLITKIKKYLDARKELYAYQYPKNNLKYFRDIPNEKEVTPARAAYLYYFKNNRSTSNYSINKIFSATILDLALKGMIEFEPISKKNVKIIIIAEKMENASKILTTDENIVYSLLKRASHNKGYVTTEELNDYGKLEYDSFHDSIESLKDAGETYIKDKYYDSERKEKADYWTRKTALYSALFLIMIVVLMVSVVIPIAFIVASICTIEILICSKICSKNSNMVCVLTEEGNEEMYQWKALKNYMSDFSLLKDKEVPDLILWEKYLVYATAFGISKKVIEQLKVVYPEMMNNDSYDSNYTYLYLMSNSSFENNFLDSFSDQLGRSYSTAVSAYNSAHPSSGDGGGGGFSSGGGDRRRRWPVAVVVKI